MWEHEKLVVHQKALKATCPQGHLDEIAAILTKLINTLPARR